MIAALLDPLGEWRVRVSHEKAHARLLGEPPLPCRAERHDLGCRSLFAQLSRRKLPILLLQERPREARITKAQGFLDFRECLSFFYQAILSGRLRSGRRGKRRWVPSDDVGTRGNHFCDLRRCWQCLLNLSL